MDAAAAAERRFGAECRHSAVSEEAPRAGPNPPRSETASRNLSSPDPKKPRPRRPGSRRAKRSAAARVGTERRWRAWASLGHRHPGSSIHSASVGRAAPGSSSGAQSVERASSSRLRPCGAPLTIAPIRSWREISASMRAPSSSRADRAASSRSHSPQMTRARPSRRRKAK